MHVRFHSIGPGLAFMAMLGALSIGSQRAAYADGHLPIVNIVPISSFTTTSDGIDVHGGPKSPPPTNGDIEIDGTVTLPVAKNFSLSYDRISLGTFDSHLSAVNLPGLGRIFPGGSRDLIQSYRGDYKAGSFNIEGGFAHRFTRCCPFDAFEWHKGFLGLSYTTPPISLINGGVFILGITANASHQNLSPNSLAALPPGLALKNNTEVFTTTQAATALIPIDKKNGLSVAGTFVWGALNYFESAPFPWYYDVWIISLTKQVNPYFGFTIRAENDEQRIQGSPFPPPNAIRTADLSVLANIHLDFNKIIHVAPPHPAQPATSGSQAPLEPAQGGTASPAPAASAKP